MDVGNSQRGRHPGQVHGSQVIGLVGQLRVRVNGGDGRVDDEIRFKAGDIVFDIFGYPETQLFAVRSPQIDAVIDLGLEVMGDAAADQPGTTDQHPDFFGRVFSQTHDLLPSPQPLCL